MSQLSEKQRMRDALRITERNLSSMIGGGFSPTTIMARSFTETMNDWRNMCRRALGYSNAVERECICPQCGIRHGLINRDPGF